MLHRFLYFFLFAVLSGISVCAQFKKYSNEFLNIGAGARAMAMGNANLSSVDDATAGYWNPSNLMNVNDFATMSIMHADYFAGIAKYDYFSVAKPIQNNKRVLGCSIVRFAVDDIPNTLFWSSPMVALITITFRVFHLQILPCFYPMLSSLKKSESSISMPVQMLKSFEEKLVSLPRHGVLDWMLPFQPVVKTGQLH